VQRIDQRRIQLQQGFSSCADDEPLSAVVPRPTLSNRIRELVRRAELAAAVTIRSEEIRVAEFADCLRAIRLAAAPEIASTEAAEDSSAPGIYALALQRVKDLFDCVWQC
jgi:hypothetical protein